MPKLARKLTAINFLLPGTFSQQTFRSASLTSAINRGKRKSLSLGSPKNDRRFKDENDPVVRYHMVKKETSLEKDSPDISRNHEQRSDVSSQEVSPWDGASQLNSGDSFSDSSTPGSFIGLPYSLRREPSRARDRPGNSNNGRSADRLLNSSRRRGDAAAKTHVKVPSAVPYTTPASEFIYGTSAIRSALRCARRKLYKLYIYDGMLKQSAGSRDETLTKLALLNGVQVKNVAGDWIRLLDKMSGGRPHNGYILEASPLPKLPVLNLHPIDSSSSAESFRVALGHQSREEEEVNGTNNCIPILGRFNSPSSEGPAPPRYPFMLLLDGILDPGNLGAIIRSAYYLGVDAITFAARNSAPFSPVTIKSSAGAAENIPLLSVTNTVQFVDTSRSNGWRFFAAEAPGSASSKRNTGRHPHGYSFPTHASLPELSQTLTKSPCVLMLGGEGMGLSSNLRKRADTFIGIPGARMNDVQGDIAGVDSLNVSVASALLCEAFLRAPTNSPTIPEHDKPALGDEAESQGSPPSAPEPEQKSDPGEDEKLF